MQWQAGSKQQAAPTVFEPDQSSWGWTWLERWMAVRPWENRFLDSSIGDGVMIQESGSAQSADDTRAQSKSASKKPGSTNLCNQKTGPSQTNDVGSSPNKSLNTVPSDQAVPSKPESKLVNDVIQATQARSGRSSRSQSNPKERSVQSDKRAKKRFSLPNSGKLSLSLSLSLLQIHMQMRSCEQRDVLIALNNCRLCYKNFRLYASDLQCTSSTYNAVSVCLTMPGSQTCL